mgnify:CR=1 FL=1
MKHRNGKAVLVLICLLTAVIFSGCRSKEKEPFGGWDYESEQTKTDENATPGGIVANATTLKDAFRRDFSVGCAVSLGDIQDRNEWKFITSQFNSMTMGNEMKPESLLDQYESEHSSDGMPVISTNRLNQILEKAENANMKLRGHCLVWHSQTPEWFFYDHYDTMEKKADKATMQKRMESYIKQVITYCQSTHPGVIYAWDVVNEGIDDNGGFRQESNWWEAYGDESYIFDAFRFAKKYVDPDVSLFLNDYNEYAPDKTQDLVDLIQRLKKEDLIDGFGMQSHWDMDYPSLDLLKDALKAYGSIPDLEVQLTEIDMHNTDNSPSGLQTQADRYRSFFHAILDAKRSGETNITNVTFWGVNDEETWLTNFRGEESFPLLFDKNNKKKPCFDAILDEAKKEEEIND